MTQNISKGKILHKSSKLEHFQLGVNILWVQIFRGLKFWASQKFSFPRIIIFVIFWTGGKNSLDYIEKKYGNIG